MDGTDRAGDDRTFRIKFGSEGTTRLRETVKERLKEIMGDYTDDTLVEYVLVLLRNGRSKEEARRELNVFLGDDGVPFVSWLWNHLSSSMHLYAQPEELLSEDVAKSNRILDDQCGGHKSQQEDMHGIVKDYSENERGDLSKTSRSRHTNDRKGLVKEENNPFPLRSTVTRILHSEERKSIRANVKRSLSPRPQIGKKRSRDDGQQPVKRDAAPRPVIGASRRLLQFAVRDAVKTMQQASTRTEPDLKRLRSVVSTTMEEPFLDERPQRLRSVARVPGALSTALKAAAEAAEDVTKDRGPGSVFDRLSRGAYVDEPIKQSSMEPMLDEGEYENPNQIPESTNTEYYQRSGYDGGFPGDMAMSDRIAALLDDSASDNDKYDNVAVLRNRGLNTSNSAVSENRDKKSLTLQCSVAQNADEVVKNTRLIDHDPSSSATAKASSKIMNISVNVNTWKPPHFQVPKNIREAGNRDAVGRADMSAERTNVQQKENDTAMTENEIARADVQKELQNKGTLTSTPGSYTSSRPSDDVDSRTVFVSNVHFAATKDSLSRHFNKFGEVLKVIIVSDAATGQPKGSAYVEFLRQESAESALSLNGTSFLSRSLKVVHKSSMHSETAPMIGWPQIARASPFASRVRRAAFSRGVLPGAFRARFPIKPGARSLQWKREDSAADGTKATQNNNPLTAVTNVSSPTGRNLTYIRAEYKVDASSGPT